MTLLFTDPVHDGPTDPLVVRNPLRGEWWMFYTRRRADLEDEGVRWVHGSDIGIAASPDGLRWRHHGIALGLDSRRTGEPRDTYWAPEVVAAGGRFHMFVTVVAGIRADWSGTAEIVHYLSDDLETWRPVGPVPLTGYRTIDACVLPLPGGGHRMWFKDEASGGHTWSADSPDLLTWSDPVEVLGDPGHEGPVAFRLGDRYWMLTDEWRGLAVHRSTDLERWQRVGRILDGPGPLPGDGPYGHHASVVVQDGTARLYYFTHPGRSVPADGPEDRSRRRSEVRVATLTAHGDRLHCDRAPGRRAGLRVPDGEARAPGAAAINGRVR